MAGAQGFEDLWRRAFELNMRLYADMGKLTLDYLKNLATIASNSPGGVFTIGNVSPRAEVPHPAAKPAGGDATMVLEGEADGTAVGVFLIGNSLPHEVSAAVSASKIVDDGGHEGKVTFTFEPAVISLRPGEQVLVRVTAIIDPSLEAGVRYRGEFSIPELHGTRIPVIVMRQLAPARKAS